MNNVQSRYSCPLYYSKNGSWTLSSKTFKLCSTKKIMFKWIVYFTFIENIVHLLSFCWKTQVVIKNTHFNSVVKDWFRDWGSFVPTLQWTQTTLLFFFFSLSFCVHAFLYFVVSCYQLLHFCQGALPASCSPPFLGWRAFSLGHLQSQGNWKSGYC